MDRRGVRDLLNFIIAILFFPIYLPHIIVYLIFGKVRLYIDSDLDRRKNKLNFSLLNLLVFLFYIHNDNCFRTLFYHRIGPVLSLLIGWWRPGDPYFVISKTTSIGKGAYFAHPFSTEINAKSIGDNFSCRHLTTIGNKRDGDNDSRPIIGNNVTLGVNVTIIGNVTIGDNVTIGAGSVVVKNIPSNCVAVGNPCIPIRFLELNNNE